MRGPNKIAIVVFASSVLALAQLGCEGCGCSESSLIAELKSKDGTVYRDHAVSIEKWSTAAEAARFFLGDGIRTLEKSGAVLAMADDAELHLKQSTQIRFQDEMPKPGSVGLTVESGEAELVVGKEELEIVMPELGRAVMSSGSRTRLKRDGTGIELQVDIGNASIHKADGEVESLSQGESLRIEIGDVELEKLSKTPAAETADPLDENDGGPQANELEALPEGAVRLDVKGKGAKIRRPGQQWQPLQEGGNAAPAKSRLSLPKKVRVNLNRDGEIATLVGSGDFVVGGAGEPLVTANRGKVIVDNTDRSLTVVVPGGKIVTAAKPGESMRAEFNSGKNGTRVKVQSGAAEVHSENGMEIVRGGSEGFIDVIDEATEYTFDTGPKTADLRVGAGESFIVHATKPPVVVGFEVGDRCSTDAVVTIEGKWGGTRGQGVVNTPLKRGRSRYKVRCLDENGKPGDTVATGKVVVLRDSGRSSLPRKPPRSMVELDGRRYRISYQNLLPVVKVRWPGAPSSDAYTLALKTSSGKNLDINVKKAEYNFTSGALSEGTHKLTFSAKDTGRKSRTSSVQILFDNAAPKANIILPGEGTFGAGQQVPIKGIALPGWSVSVPGGNLEVDKYNRFFGDIQYGGQNRAIGIRLAHAKRGVHYYLRRANNSP